MGQDGPLSQHLFPHMVRTYGMNRREHVEKRIKGRRLAHLVAAARCDHEPSVSKRDRDLLSQTGFADSRLAHERQHLAVALEHLVEKLHGAYALALPADDR